MKLASLRTGVESWDDSLNSIERDTLALRQSSPLTTTPEEELMRKGGHERAAQGMRSRAEGDNRSAANKAQQDESQSSRRGVRGKLEGRVGVVGRVALAQAKNATSHGFTPDIGVVAREAYNNEHGFSKPKSTCSVAKYTTAHIRIAVGSAAC